MHPFRCLLLAGILACASCASHSLIGDVEGVNDGRPMVFGTSLPQAEADITKGSASLDADFLVDTWKNFGASTQQVVMHHYRVDYTAGAAFPWNYVGVNNQPQRYWDLSAFPYEFRAVSPALGGISIGEGGISISQPFRAQTLLDGSYQLPGNEPCLVAHVSRSKTASGYEDRDRIKDAEINAASRANAVREVHMPFHHLMSKVGFRIFIDDPQPDSPDYRVTLNSICIRVVNSDDSFVTASSQYTATDAQGLGKGTFSGNTVQSGAFTLLSHGEYTGLNLRQHLNRESAYDLSPDYLLQIPQGNISLQVDVQLTTSDNVSFPCHTVLENLAWEPDKRYNYILHIPNLHGHQVFLDTCEVLPWEAVQTSDIPVEL